MGKATRKLPTLNAAARRVVELWPEQMVPLQDLCEAVGVLSAVLDSDAKRRSNRTKGKAGRKAREGLLDQIDGLLGQRVKVSVIAEAVGCSESYVRQRKASLYGRPVAARR